MQEDELVIDPAFFVALTKHIPQITQVKICPKRGHFENEMTSFRYDVILHTGEGFSFIDKIDWIDWREKKLTIEELRAVVKTRNDEPIGFKNIPNRRMREALLATELLNTPGKVSTVKDLQQALQKSNSDQGVTPEDLYTLGSALGLQVQTSWLGANIDGAFDAVFYNSNQVGSEFVFPSPEYDGHRSWSEYATNPPQGKL